jgi:pyridoxamine 5'-phosphate oxidase
MLLNLPQPLVAVPPTKTYACSAHQRNCDQAVSHDQKDTRRDYSHSALHRNDLQPDPLLQFKLWMDDALAAELTDATAMSLATADTGGKPSNRIVLLKTFDDRGYTWFTDYRSHKGADLAANPQAALLFYWREFERQVRIEGPVAQVSPGESAEYFHSRPLDSRLAAAVSHQSAAVDNRELLEEAVARLREAHPDGEVPAPEDWGGYRLQPQRYEFWQGREGRLHDRFRYTQDAGDWRIERLQP